MDETMRSEDAAPGPFGRWALPLVCAIACVLFVAGAIAFYFGMGFPLSLNSDAAVPVLLADEVLRSGRPVPSTWYFGNNEIWTLAPHVFMLPFVATLGVSTLALKLGDIFCLAVIVAFMTLTVHRIVRSWPYAIVVAAVVFAAFSGLQESAVYSQTAYGWFTAQFALLLYLALRMQDEADEPRRLFGHVPWPVALYVFLLVNLAVDSPMRAGTYWVVPLLAVSLAFPVARRRSFALIAWTLAAFLAGAICRYVIWQHILTDPGVSARLVKPNSEWVTDIKNIWAGLPMLTGWAQKPYASVFGALDRIRFCVIALAGVVVLFAPAGNGAGSAECRFFARVSGVMLLVVLGVLTVGRLNVDPAVVRYLAPPTLLSIAAFMAILWCRWRTHTWRIAAIAGCFVLMFCGSALMRVTRFGSIAFDRPCDAPSNNCRLESLLEKTGVRRGFATYWKGNVTTLVSNGQIKTCGVQLRPALAPFRWLTPKDCFDRPSEDRYFLALDRAEIAAAGREHLIAQAGTPAEIVTGDAFEIWIFQTADAKTDWLQR